MEFAPDSASRQKSVEAAKQAAEQLEAVRHRLEAQRTDQEDKMKSEREGIIVYLHAICLHIYHCYSSSYATAATHKNHLVLVSSIPWQEKQHFVSYGQIVSDRQL